MTIKKTGKILFFICFYTGLSLFILVWIASVFILPKLFTPSEEKIATAFSGKPYGVTFTTYVSEGRELWVAVSGPDTLPPLLLIHGSPGEWSNLLSQMAGEEINGKFHVIAPNRPGYAPWDNGTGEVTLTAQARILTGLLEMNHSGKKPMLVGHSLGGPIVCRMAMDYPEKIGGLVIVAGSLDPELEKNEWFRPLYSIWPLHLMISGSLRASNEELYPLKQELYKMMPLWEKITCPVIVVQGDKDNLVPKENADFAARHLTKAVSLEIRMEKGENHFIPWEKPEAVNQAITDLYLLMEIQATNQVNLNLPSE